MIPLFSMFRVLLVCEFIVSFHYILILIYNILIAGPFEDLILGDIPISVIDTWSPDMSQKYFKKQKMVGNIKTVDVLVAVLCAELDMYILTNL